MLAFAMPSYLFLAALWSPSGMGWPLGSLCVVFSCVLLRFVAFPSDIPGRVCCLVVSMPDLCHFLYFE